MSSHQNLWQTSAALWFVPADSPNYVHVAEGNDSAGLPYDTLLQFTQREGKQDAPASPHRLEPPEHIAQCFRT